MATGLQARLQAAADPVFQQRVAEAVAEAAVAIYNEGGTVQGHAARAAFATAILNDPPQAVMLGQAAPNVQVNGVTIQAKRAAAFAVALVTQGIDGTSSDSAISTGVASVWNALAGA